MSCLLTDFSQESENLFTEIWDNHKFDKIGIFVSIFRIVIENILTWLKCRARIKRERERERKRGNKF